LAVFAVNREKKRKWLRGCRVLKKGKASLRTSEGGAIAKIHRQRGKFEESWSAP